MVKEFNFIWNREDTCICKKLSGIFTGLGMRVSGCGPDAPLATQPDIQDSFF
jgi:hypothetical protein